MPGKPVFEYTITAKSHLRHLWIVIFALLVFSLLPFYMILKFGELDYKIFIPLAIIAFLITVIPQIILHIRYMQWNAGAKLSFYPAEQRFTYFQNNEEIRFSIQDIEYSARKMTFLFGKNEWHVLPWEDYNYSIIFLKSHQKIIITSLLANDLDLTPYSVKTIIKRSFFPF